MSKWINEMDFLTSLVKKSVYSTKTIGEALDESESIELVRCKDCIWYLKDGSCARHLKQFEPYYYCSYGERGDTDDETGSD